MLDQLLQFFEATTRVEDKDKEDLTLDSLDLGEGARSVLLFSSPWPLTPYVTNGYEGPISVNITETLELEEGIEKVLKKLKLKAWKSGANAVLGIEIFIKLWEDPVQFEARGVASIVSKK